MSIAGTVAKNSLFNFIAATFDSVAVFVAGIVLARGLGTEQYGLYIFMMWFLSLAALAVNLGMGEMSRRFIAEAIGQNNMNVTKGLVQLNLVVRGAVTLLAALLILIFSGHLARLLNMPDNSRYFMLIAALLLSYVPVITLQGIFAGFQKYEYSAFLTIVISLLRALLLIFLVVYGFSVMRVLTAYLAMWILGTIIGFLLLKRLLPLRDLLLPSLLKPKTRKSAVQYSLTATGLLVVDYILWQQAEILLLGMYRTVEEVGFYNIAHRIPTMAINLAPFVVGQVLLPAVAEQFGKGDTEKIKTIYSTAARYLMLLSLPIAAGGIALAKPIIELLFGESYGPAIILMQIVFIPYAMRGLTHSVSSVIYGIKEPGFLFKVGVILAVISVGLNFWLIPLYGALGAVIATAVPRIVSLPIYIRFVSKKIKESWPMRDTVKITLAAVLMGAVIYAIQSQLGVALSLGLCVPLGIVIYIVEVFLFRIIDRRDMEIMEKVQESLPRGFRKYYGYLLRIAAKIMSITQPQNTR